MLLSSYVAKPELLCKYTKKPLKKYVDNFKLIHIKKYLSTKKPYQFNDRVYLNLKYHMNNAYINNLFYWVPTPTTK